MNARHLLAAPVVAAAVAGPYLALDDPWRQMQSLGAAGGVTANEPDKLALPDLPDEVALPADLADVAAPAIAPSAAAETATTTSALDVSQAKLVGPVVGDFAEVLRFDVTPEWIFSRWSRVTTVTANQALKGFRAPLVTGPREDDLAGAATFYFGRQGRLQRLSFEGRTGDTRRLVAFLTQNYGFRPEPSLGAGLYLVTWNAQPMSALRVDYAPVVRAEAPHLRYTIQFEINRPDNAYGMSDDLRRILDNDQDTKRWTRF